MEKNFSEVVKGLTYIEFVRSIFTEARKAKNQIPVFVDPGNGCIRVTTVPLQKTVDDWMGGLSEYDEDGKCIDLHEYEHIKAISPGGSHTIQWKSPEDGHTEPVNCYAYSALKIAYLSRLRKKGIFKDDDSELKTGCFVEENGWSIHEGARCTTVSLNGEALMRIYICFSGAESKEDQLCADATNAAMRKILLKQDENLKFSSRAIISSC